MSWVFSPPSADPNLCRACAFALLRSFISGIKWLVKMYNCKTRHLRSKNKTGRCIRRSIIISTNFGLSSGRWSMRDGGFGEHAKALTKFDISVIHLLATKWEKRFYQAALNRHPIHSSSNNETKHECNNCKKYSRQWVKKTDSTIYADYFLKYYAEVEMCPFLIPLRQEKLTKRDIFRQINMQYSFTNF